MQQLAAAHACSPHPALRATLSQRARVFVAHGLVCYPLLRSRPLGFVALAVVALLVFWHPARVAAQTLILLPALFPGAPVDPLAAVVAQPSRTEHTFSYVAGTVEATIFHPGDAGKHGALILVLGAGDLPRSDLAVHFAEALARLGVVVMLPQSTGLAEERLTFGEIDALRNSFNLLVSQPDVDPNRAGFVGLSASGGLSIVAAGLPDLRDRVRFVNSFGSYYDATSLLLDVASRSMEVDGREVAWQPEQRTQDVVAKSLADTDGPEVSELLAGTTRARGRELVAHLPLATQERLREISPATYLSQVKAHVYLMHDLDDTFIPFTESRAMVGADVNGAVKRYTEFEIFAHVIPDRPVPWQTFVPDLWRLYWHIYSVLLEVL
jgi:acetyl esterase/lipase